MYFDKAGEQNTKACVEEAMRVAKERGIKDVVIATVYGGSMEYFPDPTDYNGVCITHSYGFKVPGENQMSDDVRRRLQDRGFKVYTSSHALGSTDRGVSVKSGGTSPAEMIATTLRFFGQGMKVAVEVATMAADGGLIKPGVPIIAFGGTSRGLDTAIIMRAAHARDILETTIEEIICMPKEK